MKYTIGRGAEGITVKVSKVKLTKIQFYDSPEETRKNIHDFLSAKGVPESEIVIRPIYYKKLPGKLKIKIPTYHHEFSYKL